MFEHLLRNIQCISWLLVYYEYADILGSRCIWLAAKDITILIALLVALKLWSCVCTRLANITLQNEMWHYAYKFSNYA